MGADHARPDRSYNKLPCALRAIIVNNSSGGSTSGCARRCSELRLAAIHRSSVHDLGTQQSVGSVAFCG